MRESHRRLLGAGVEIEVLAPSWKGLKSHFIDQVPVRRFRYAPASLEILTHDEGAPTKLAKRPWMQLLAIPYILVGFFLCFWICLRRRPHVIHAHWPFPHGLIALAGKWFFGVPVVLNFHGAELLLVRKHPWVKHVLSFLLGRADSVLANSSFTAAKIEAIRKVPVVLSPYGTTIPERSAEPVSRGLQASPFVALFVGRHIERKGLSVLIQAAAKLDPLLYQIRIVGHGDLSESLQAQVRELGLAHVIFTGKLTQDELAQEYQKANCFVMPSIVDSRGDTEGLGVVLIEAAELGLPLVASNVGGIPDVVVDGETGLLVPQKDPQALCDALIRLAQESGLATRLVEGAKRRIAENFSWDGIIARQVDLYVRLGLRGR
jgi:glycosyltransferase involved in cell wall biosynthesis